MPGEKPFTSNGNTSDPREQICWDIYIEQLQEGLDNAYQSAIQAGYSQASAKNVTMRDWFKERLRKLKRKDMLSKSERKLERTLDYEVEEIDENGKMKVRTDLLKIQVDVAKTLVTTLGKNEGYSSRNELTGKDGENLPTPLLYALPNNDSNKEDNETEEAN